MNEMLKKLAEASDWTIAEERIKDMESLFAGTMDDTRSVRELELGSTPPAIVYKASAE